MEESEQRVQPVAKNARAPITWRAHEYVHTEKNSDWYWALGLIVVAGALFALLKNNVMFAILILIAGFVLALFATMKPKHIEFAVTQRGVRIDKELLPYSSLESFAVDELSPNHVPKLIIESKKLLAPHIVIPIEEVSPDDVHDFLLNYLPEDDHVEPLTNRVMEWLGF
jgi:hypothetical protein